MTRLTTRLADALRRFMVEVPPSAYAYAEGRDALAEYDANPVPKLQPHGDPFAKFFDFAEAANSGDTEAENNFLRMIGAVPDIGGDVAGPQPEPFEDEPLPDEDAADLMRWLDDGGRVHDSDGDDVTLELQLLRFVGFDVVHTEGLEKTV